jgi:hypothetical protein
MAPPFLVARFGSSHLNPRSASRRPLFWPKFKPGDLPRLQLSYRESGDPRRLHMICIALGDPPRLHTRGGLPHPQSPFFDPEIQPFLILRSTVEMYAVTPYARRRHARTSKGEAPSRVIKLAPRPDWPDIRHPAPAKANRNREASELSSSLPLSKRTFLRQPIQHRGSVYLPPRKVECACTL